jgi:hypothetical protein
VNTAVAGSLPVRSEGRYFYLWMAGICVLVAFGGFTPTFWAKIAAGTFRAPPMVYVHGAILFTWTIFYFVQTALVAYGRTMDHRNWGLAGIALFSVMMCVILVTQMAVLKHANALGFGDAARRFAAVTLCAWPMMAVFFTLAIVNIRHPQVHKRLMLLLMIAMLTPAIARVFLTVLAPPGAASAGPPPPFVSLPPALVADLLILVAMFHDWRTRGRPHAVYMFGGLALLAQQALTVPFAATATWMSIATAFEHLAG